MFEHAAHDNPISRRLMIGRMARAALGVTVVDALADPLASAQAATAPKTGDVSVIFLMMRGAMSHLDTFDPKPGREEQGETKAIQTKTPGVLFGEHLPKLAGMADRLAVLRGMTTETGAHEQGTYLMRTSYTQLNSIVHPSMGSWTLHVKGKQSRDLPGYVLVGNGNEHPGAGFLDASLTPVPIADPKLGLENTRLPAYLSERQFQRRLSLADRIDRDFRQRYAGPQIAAYDQMYKDATRLLGSVDLQAFDISKEPEAVRGRYGETTFGQGCLLARRLVESGVRCVEVEFNKWDMPVVDSETHQSTNPKVFLGGDAAWGPKNIIWAVAHGHEAAISIDLHCQGRPVTDRPPQGMNLLSMKNGLHSWAYDNGFDASGRQVMRHEELTKRFRDLQTEVELGFTPEQVATEVSRCLNCDIQTSFNAPKCIECDACIDVCPTACLTITKPQATEAELRKHLTVPAVNMDQDIYHSDPLPQTERLMVKDEDVCLHCGLCAERCPTAAWDMQLFDLLQPKAGASCHEEVPATV